MGDVVVLSPAELASLVRDAVADALAAREQAAAPALCDQAGIARALGVSTPTIRKMVRDGMPELRVGDAPRYELATCIAWLRARGAR